ncbi:ankyrin repeat domain-containing protein [Candidatus Jidaibacter acanthamoebae]|nr:ankyrin repeat domain-containing protein [Candidatus Jidaibacter acanthamoeba]
MLDKNKILDNRTKDKFFSYIEKGDKEELEKILSKASKQKVLPLLQNTIDNRGRKALHLAAYLGQNDIIDVLVNHGFDKFTANKFGESAVHFAVLGNKISTFEFLVNTCKLDPHFPNLEHETPLMYAIKRHYDEFVKCIDEKYGSEIPKEYKGDITKNYYFEKSKMLEEALTKANNEKEQTGVENELLKSEIEALKNKTFSKSTEELSMISDSIEKFNIENKTVSKKEKVAPEKQSEKISRKKRPHEQILSLKTEEKIDKGEKPKFISDIINKQAGKKRKENEEKSDKSVSRGI